MWRLLGFFLVSKMNKIPKILVFDLDGCVWNPEMYELMWGPGGGPFKVRPDGDLSDKSGEHIYLMGDVRKIMDELKHDAKWSETKVAIGILSHRFKFVQC
jgi:magnesium-dependent phosphatase 1